MLRWIGLIFGGLLLVILAGGFFWWQHYKSTPAYSLALVVDAAQRNDGEAFDRVVDMERVVDNFIPQVAQAATGGLASEVATSLRRQLQSLAPDVMAGLQQALKEEIRKLINEVAGPERPFLMTALAIPFKASFSDGNDTAKATINSGDHQVELTMERLDSGYWRVISLRDDALAARVADNIVKNLPGSGSPLDKGIRKQLENLPETLRKFPIVP